MNILFLCTGNSARSIMAEALLNHLGGGRLRAFSAGSQPKGDVHPLALETLQRHDVPAGQPHSKSWDQFAQPDAPSMDLVITVCDNAAGEICPVWPGHPARAHWSLPDPAAVTGPIEERRQAFERVFESLQRAVAQLTSVAEPSSDDLSRAARSVGEELADRRP